MLLGAVASTGEKSPPIWFPQGFRLNADAYIEALDRTLVPWMRRVVAAHGGARPAPILFQQDGAPAHTARKTVQYFEGQGIPFIRPQEWPPNSPDLNPLDYSIWSLITAGTAGKARPGSVQVLKRQVNAAWRNMEPEKIRTACGGFRPRLQRCIAAKGSFFDEA